MLSSLKHNKFRGIFVKNKGKKPEFSGYRLGAVLLVMLILGLAGVSGAAGPLNQPQEKALFSMADLGAVDLSTKTVTVEIFVSPDSELNACRRMLPLAWERVQQFYAHLGVNLVQAPGQADPGALAPAQRLRIEFLPHKEWLNRSFKAFNVAPPFRLRFLQVCRDKCAFAHLPLSTIHISFRRFEETELKPGKAQQNRDWLANLMIHELGHLLGLYHAHEFANDQIPEFLPGRTPNFMSQKIAFKSRLGFVDLQKRMIHSFLSKGKVFQQYQYVEFDPLRYLELLKTHNGYREPVKGGKMAQRVKKSGNPRTFDDDDVDDEED